MTAVMYTNPVLESAVAESLLDDPVGIAIDGSIDEFLRDPIGFGDYDFTDPISLVEFSTCRHFKGIYAEALT